MSMCSLKRLCSCGTNSCKIRPVKKPKGTKKDIEVLGATTKVKSTNLKSTNSNYSSSNYGGSSEIAFMDPPGPIRLLGLTVSGLDEEVPMQDSLLNHLK